MCFLVSSAVADASAEPGTLSRAMEVGSTDQAAPSHHVFANGVRGALRVGSPLLSPAPAAASRPAEGCRRVPKNRSAGARSLPGSSGPSDVQFSDVSQGKKNKKKIDVSGSESSYLRLRRIFVNAVTVYHSRVRGGWGYVRAVAITVGLMEQPEVSMSRFVWISGP